ACHAHDGIRRLASGTRHTGVVKQNDRPIFREPIRHVGIPVVEAATEVLQKDDWCPRRRSKPPIRIHDTIRPDDPRFRCVVCVAHGCSSLQYASPNDREISWPACVSARPPSASPAIFLAPCGAVASARWRSWRTVSESLSKSHLRSRGPRGRSSLVGTSIPCPTLPSLLR